MNTTPDTDLPDTRWYPDMTEAQWVEKLNKLTPDQLREAMRRGQLTSRCTTMTLPKYQIHQAVCALYPESTSYLQYIVQEVKIHLHQGGQSVKYRLTPGPKACVIWPMGKFIEFWLPESEVFSSSEDLIQQMINRSAPRREPAWTKHEHNSTTEFPPAVEAEIKPL